MPSRNQELSDSPAGVQALHILLDKLRNNEYPPGTPLRETVLAVEFNLSRNAVREALNRMVGWDIVEYLPFRGYRIRNLSLRDLLEWYELREAIEPIAARRLAMIRSPKVIDELEKHNEVERAALARGDLAAADEAEQAFHSAIVENCGNRSFVRQQNRGYMAMMFLLGSRCLRECPDYRAAGSYSDKENDRQTCRVHSEIIDLIRAGKAEEAEALVKLHCKIHVQQLMDLIAIDPETTSDKKGK